MSKKTNPGGIVPEGTGIKFYKHDPRRQFWDLRESYEKYMSLARVYQDHDPDLGLDLFNLAYLIYKADQEDKDLEELLDVYRSTGSIKTLIGPIEKSKQ